MTANIPKYVKQTLRRSAYEYDKCVDHDDYALGHTLSVAKESPYQHIRTLESEIEKVAAWCNKQQKGSCKVLYIPKETHYEVQHAVITIYDPLMKHLEKHIGRTSETENEEEKN